MGRLTGTDFNSSTGSGTVYLYLCIVRNAALMHHAAARMTNGGALPFVPYVLPFRTYVHTCT